MSLEMALLGFLSYRPMTGYDMKKMTDNVGPSWTAPQSQIYTALHSLEKRELVTVEVVQQDTKPNRKLYHMTPKGEEALQEWMSEAHPPRVLRNPFLLQLWFAGLVDDVVRGQKRLVAAFPEPTVRDEGDRVRGHLAVGIRCPPDVADNSVQAARSPRSAARATASAALRQTAPTTSAPPRPRMRYCSRGTPRRWRPRGG